MELWTTLMITVLVAGVAHAANITVTCPTHTVPPGRMDGIIVGWQAKNDREANVSDVIFYDNDPLCSNSFQGGKVDNGGGDVTFDGNTTIQCTDQVHNNYSFYIMEIYGSRQIITTDDKLYNVTCIYDFKQNISAVVAVLLDTNTWNYTGAPIVETTVAIATEVAVLLVIQEGTEDTDITGQTTAVGSVLHLQANVSVLNFAMFKVVHVWAFIDNCTKPSCAKYEVYQLYDAECPTDNAMTDIQLSGPISIATGDAAFNVKVTSNFTSFRFGEPTNPQGGTDMVFVAEIYLCREETDPACVQDTCETALPGKRRRKRAVEPDQIVMLQAPVTVIDPAELPTDSPTEAPATAGDRAEAVCTYDLSPYFLAIGALLLALFICLLVIAVLARRLRRRKETEEETEYYYKGISRPSTSTYLTPSI